MMRLWLLGVAFLMGSDSRAVLLMQAQRHSTSASACDNSLTAQARCPIDQVGLSGKRATLFAVPRFQATKYRAKQMTVAEERERLNRQRHLASYGALRRRLAAINPPDAQRFGCQPAKICRSLRH